MWLSTNFNSPNESAEPMTDQEYSEQALRELKFWREKMQQKAGFTDRMSSAAQQRLNGLIPEKVHLVITRSMKIMVSSILKGAEWTSAKPVTQGDLRYREALVRDKISFYTGASTTEGALTGAGGLLWGMADFPIWLSLKMKMLSEIAAIYGCDLTRKSERLYLLYIFQACFSSQQKRPEVFHNLDNWTTSKDVSSYDFDWRTFQQEYRDKIDLAKLVQLIPGIGALAGAWVNRKWTRKLGETAMNAYRLRWFESELRLG